MKTKLSNTVATFQRRSAEFLAAGARLRSAEEGQDLIEYALMAATIAVSVAVIFPQSIAPNISAIFSKVNATLLSANN